MVEGCAHGLEVAGQTRVVRLETVRAVEAEVAGVEVRVDLRLRSCQSLKFACPYQAHYEFVAYGLVRTHR
jgi:hypothetical protein